MRAPPAPASVLGLLLLLRGANSDAQGRWLVDGTLATGNTSTVSDLLDRLLALDNMDVRVPMPVREGGPNVVVFFDLAMNKLIQFNEVEGVAQWSIFYRLFWRDDRLRFNGTEEFGADWVVAEDALTVEEADIWTPHVVPYYSKGDAFGTAGIRVYDSNFLKENKYNLLWSRPALVNVHCDTNLEEFPFDTQECTLIVGPWSNALAYGLRSKRRADEGRDIFVGELHSEEWQVVSTHFRNVSQVYLTGFSEEVHYTMSFRRYPHYYLVNAVLPMMLVVALSALTMWLPIEGGSGERLGFSVTLLLTINAMALFTAESRPATKEETWLDHYQAWCLVLTFFPVAESVLVVWLQHLYEKVGGEARETRKEASDGTSDAAAAARQTERAPSNNSIETTPMSPQARLMRTVMDSAVTRNAEQAMQADVRTRMVVYLFHRLPSLEKCITGKKTEHFQPRTLDRWFRQCFAAVILIVFSFLARRVPYEAVTGWSSALLIGALSMTMLFYFCVAICSGLFVAFRVSAMCGEPRQ